MLTFLLVLVLIFIAVDLFVQLVIDPLASKAEKKEKLKRSSTNNIEPEISLVGATMYDGGKSKEDKPSTCDDKKDDKSQPE